MGRKTKKVKLYMAVTNDDYELPLFVTENLYTMQRKFGVKENTILKSIDRMKQGKGKGQKARFRAVTVDFYEKDGIYFY